ncbi:MupG family TIM beta-alpha barrel fold protein [Mycoplasma leachii]|uniref:Outer surface protein n=1 Tax=Mycoplasma leachii 06049 TaxID=1188244 RepID=A0A2T4I9P8_9MOLU|nr:MupG family TIM beta-alpha barrel fold protein [Mycoplasma leachii]PTD31247.1 hypothetical protein MLEAa_5030 [Mycoplasma leachii 06049]
MEKKKLGISVYCKKASFDQIIEYLKLARSYNFEILFISFVHLVKNDYFKNIDVIKKAKELNYYVIADFDQTSLNNLTKSNDLKILKEIGIDCIRFDQQIDAQSLADLTYNPYDIDVQLNISNSFNFLDNVLDFKPILTRLSGSHNFYLLKDSALDIDFFNKTTDKFIRKNLNTSAFISSQIANITLADNYTKAVSLEFFRNIDIISQARYLFYSNKINNVIIANMFASKKELEQLSLLNKDHLTLKINNLQKISKTEKEILLWNNHFRRSDINTSYIRSTFSRTIWNSFDIKPNNIKQVFNKGDIVILNNNANRYKGELHIILKDNYIDNNNLYNYIASVHSDELYLLDFIDSNSHFKISL